MRKKKAHFIGICGKGMSATALLLREQGWSISGSDSGFYPPVSNYLTESGIVFATKYEKENIPDDADIVVIGKNARLTPEKNEEVKAAFDSKIAIRSFPEILESLTADTQNIIIAGSYAKSTCTALLAWILRESGKDPSYFIGEITNGFPTHAHLGASNTFVLEGDEYPTANWDPSPKFLYYNPTDVLLTSATHDHVNVFPTHEEYLNVFRTLLKLVPPNGLVVVNSDEQFALQLAQEPSGQTVLYGLNNTDTTWSATNFAYTETTSFDLLKNGEKVITLTTSLLGEHNIENVVGVAAYLLEKEMVTPEEFVSGLKSFKGVKRRLEKLTTSSSVYVYEGFGSSYLKAHSAIAAIKKHFPEKRLIIVFEPHQALWRSREMIHWYDDIFQSAEKALIFKPPTEWLTKDQLTLEEIVDRVKNARGKVTGFEEPEEGLRLVEQEVRDGDIVLLLTSGGLGGLIESIPKLVEGRFPTT